MSLSGLLTTDRIACAADARSKKRALEVLAETLARGDDDIGQGAVFTSLVGRERLGSTAVGHGVALPHGRLAGLRGTRAAFVRLVSPVDFEAPDGEGVDLLFGLLVPEDAGPEHLAALAAAAARFEDPAVRDALRRTDDPRAAVAILAGEGPRRHASG